MHLTYQVYICHRKPRMITPLPSNVEEKFGIASLTETGCITEDGTQTEIDVLMLCTGYKYEFPFLSSPCAVSTKDERVMPLYKHVVHIEWPTLFFVGIPKAICPFPLFDCQVQFALGTKDGRMELPSKEEMYMDTKQDFENRRGSGFPVRHAHHMAARQWDYNDDLAALAHFTPIPKVVRKIYDHVHSYRVTDLPGYKNRNIKITGPDSFEDVQP